MAEKSDILLKTALDSMLDNLEKEREIEIVTRRFGLEGDRETLEQIGNLLGVTRERVRQLEKAILIHLKILAEKNKIEGLNKIEKIIIKNLIDIGLIATNDDLTEAIVGENYTPKQKAIISFIAEISDKLIIIDDNDSYKMSIALASEGDKKVFREKIDEVVKAIKSNKEPISIENLDELVDFDHPKKIEALAKVSKKISTLDGVWGLSKWSIVNPKNIKDKIYIILKQNSKPMHYSKIAKEILESDFKRRNVTKQAIHNELIKDNRFILIGRGIYALEEWGYAGGTVADVIAKILKDYKEPMFRDDIVRAVLKRRKVKETTVLLNLQARPEFKRVAKATYQYTPVEQK